MNFKKLNIALSTVIATVTLGLSAAHAGEDFVTSAQSGEVVKNSFGECWKTGSAAAGADCEPKPAPAPAPAPVVAPAPAPAPVVIQEAPKYVTETLNADALFDFNKATLRPAGRKSIDAIVTKIKGVPSGEIIVVGHTDRIGSDAYNMRLSQARANSVKAYMAKKGVPASRVKAIGKGKTEPVTKDCKGTKKTKALVQCLQADRRVDIQIPVQQQVQ